MSEKTYVVQTAYGLTEVQGESYIVNDNGMMHVFADEAKDQVVATFAPGSWDAIVLQQPGRHE
jgi:hypothetical protein